MEDQIGDATYVIIGYVVLARKYNIKRFLHKVRTQRHDRRSRSAVAWHRCDSCVIERLPVWQLEGGRGKSRSVCQWAIQLASLPSHLLPLLHRVPYLLLLNAANCIAVTRNVDWTKEGREIFSVVAFALIDVDAELFRAVIEISNRYHCRTFSRERDWNLNRHSR